MEFTLSTLDLSIIIFYLVFVTGLGFYFGTKHKDAEDYFLAGRNLTWPIIGFSLFASNMSSNSLVGLAGAGYKDGFSVYSYEWMAVVILIIFAIFFLPFYLRNKIFTIPEYLEKRYSYKVRAYASGIAIILNILVDIAATLYAGGLVIQLIFPGLSLTTIIFGIAIIAGIYTVAGGLSSVMYTDAIQAVILIFGSTLITYFAYQAAGGWDAVYAITEPSHFDIIKPIDDEVMPWPSLIGVLIIGFYFWGTNQYITQRTLASRNLKQGQWGAIFAGFLKLSILFIMIFPGAFARVLYPDMTEMDMIYPTMLFDLLPTGVLGIVLAGLIAAMMSSLDSGLNSVSTLITMDFYNKFYSSKQATEQGALDSESITDGGASSSKLMWVGRAITVVVMIIAVAWAPQIGSFEKLWDYLQNTLAWFCPPVVALFVMGIFFKKVNNSGALLSIAVGLLITIVLITMEITGQRASLPNFLYVAGIHFGVCCLLLWIGSKVGEHKPEAELAQLVWTTDTYRQDAKALEALPWYKNYIYQSIALVVVLIIILLTY